MFPYSGTVLECDRCQGEIYPYDLVHLIDGFIICPDCFFDFVFDYFSENLVLGKDILRMRQENERT